jgi:predicted MFS family arabinose efflux permease
VARAGLLITVFAVGMIVGAPLVAMPTLRLPRRLTLILALGVFAAGHVVVALGSGFGALPAAGFLTAPATGVLLIARHVPRDADGHRAVSVRSEPSALRPGRLWLALAACAITTGGVLSTYTYTRRCSPAGPTWPPRSCPWCWPVPEPAPWRASWWAAGPRRPPVRSSTWRSGRPGRVPVEAPQA